MSQGTGENDEKARLARRALALALALTAGAAPTNAFGASCAWSVRLDGAGGPPLRAILVERNVLSSASLVCERALVSIDATGSGFRVELAVDGERVARDVATIDDAATWVESWLLPLVLDGATREATASVVVPTMPDLDRQASSATIERLAGRPGGSVGGRVALLGLAGLAQDGSRWAGGELGGQLTLRETFWFGAGFGGMSDPLFGGESAAGPGVRRRLLRATVRAGLRWTLTRDLRFDLGLGGGFASAYVTGVSGGRKLSDDESVAFAELGSVVEYRPHPNWVLLGGPSIALTGPLEATEGHEDANERALPSGHPRWFGGLTFGVGYAFFEGP